MYYFCIMKLKIFLFALLGVAMAIIFWLSAELKTTKRHLQDAEDLIEIQHDMIERLGEIDAVRAIINVEVNNRATFGSVKAGDVEVIADQVVKYARKELLNTDTLCRNTSQLYQ